MRATLFAAASAVAILAGPSAGFAAVIDMNDIPGVTHGTVVGDQLPGVQISASGSRGPAVAFDTRVNEPGESDLFEPFGAPLNVGGAISPGPTNPGFILIANENTNGCAADGVCNSPDDDARGGTLTFDFDRAVTVRSVDLFDLDQFRSGELATITLFGVGTSATVSGLDVGDSRSATVDLLALFPPTHTSGVTRMEIAFSGSGGTNRLVYAVPEPTTLALIGAGLAGLGVAAGRRRASA